MYRPVMTAAEWNRELIADLAAERAGLRKSELVGVRGLAATDEARLLHDIAKVVPVAISPRGRHREHALIDADLISAGAIRLANLTASTEAFRSIDIHTLSAFGWQELG